MCVGPGIKSINTAQRMPNPSHMGYTLKLPCALVLLLLRHEANDVDHMTLLARYILEQTLESSRTHGVVAA